MARFRAESSALIGALRKLSDALRHAESTRKLPPAEQHFVQLLRGTTFARTGQLADAETELASARVLDRDDPFVALLEAEIHCRRADAETDPAARSERVSRGTTDLFVAPRLRPSLLDTLYLHVELRPVRTAPTYLENLRHVFKL